MKLIVCRNEAKKIIGIEDGALVLMASPNNGLARAELLVAGSEDTSRKQLCALSFKKISSTTRTEDFPTFVHYVLEWHVLETSYLGLLKS